MNSKILGNNCFHPLKYLYNPEDLNKPTSLKCFNIFYFGQYFQLYKKVSALIFLPFIDFTCDFNVKISDWCGNKLNL